MTFRIDKHGQLRITTNGDLKVDPKEPDTFVLSQDETRNLAVLLRENVSRE